MLQSTQGIFLRDQVEHCLFQQTILGANSFPPALTSHGSHPQVSSPREASCADLPFKTLSPHPALQLKAADLDDHYGDRY